MRLAGQLPLLLCSNIKTLCINALKQSRTLLRMWLKIFCQAWHLFHGAHSHCKAVKLSCCLRPWHTYSSLRKYTRVMLQATHSNSDALQTPFRRTSPWSKSCSLLGHQPPNSANSQAKLFSGKADPCMILYDPHASLDGARSCRAKWTGNLVPLSSTSHAIVCSAQKLRHVASVVKIVGFVPHVMCFWITESSAIFFQIISTTW